MKTNTSPQRLLQDVLDRNPGASLDEIRDHHPIFRAMSVDQLSVRVSHVVADAADARGK